MEVKKHKWNFVRAGGSAQVNISCGKDIENLDKLDAKLWSALSCPTSGLTLDSKTLNLIDTNGDGRIRREEIIQACKWTCQNLKDSDFLLKSKKALPLEEINTDSESGRVLFACAKEILQCLGKADVAEISAEDFSDESKIFANTPFNADGVITTFSCENDEDLKAVLSTILSISSPKKDRSGADGIDNADIDAFFADSASFMAWKSLPETDNAILFLGADSETAFSAYSAVEAQINDWFARAQIIEYNSDVQTSMLAQADEKLIKAYAELDFAQLKELPIVKLNATSVIDFSKNVNPAWGAECESFKANVLDKLLGKQQLSFEDWQSLCAKFAPYKKWIASKPETKVSGIDAEVLLKITTEENKQKLLALLNRDAELKDKVENIANVEKLVYFSRDLYTLLKNFVSFQDFYSKNGTGIFQYGKLFIDRRSCDLCVKVENVASHSAMASLGYGYLLYCVCKRKGSADMNIVALVSSGDCDNLIVGRNGIFYDYLGNDWDATITKIVNNPIGISQAFFSPYKRVVKWISEQISKRAAAADKEAVANLTDSKKPADKKIDIGTVAALGVAVGGITTAFGMVLEAIFGLGYWLPLGIVGIILAISLPSMFIAALKLRMRNLAPILDGNGWAVNSKSIVNMAFGRHLTHMARLPKGSKFCKIEKFPENNTLRNLIIFTVFAALAIGGGLYFGGVFDKKCKNPTEQPQANVKVEQQKQSEQQKQPVVQPTSSQVKK